MKFLFPIIAILFCISTSEIHAQSTQDYMTLVTKKENGEFDVIGAAKVDPQGAFELFEEGAVFVDVRRAIQYKASHIKGAISLDVNSKLTEESLGKVATKDQKVVFYCSDPKCYRSAHASAKAIVWGYTAVAYFASGWSHWLAADYPRE